MRHPGPWKDADSFSSDKIVDANGDMVIESMSGYEDSSLNFGSDEAARLVLAAPELLAALRLARAALDRAQVLWTGEKGREARNAWETAHALIYRIEKGET